MAKLVNILAASLGGGLILGASIRAIESQSRSTKADGLPSDSADPSGQRLLKRLEGLESRLKRLDSTATPSSDWSASPYVLARLDAHDREADAIIARLSEAERSYSKAAEHAEKTALELKEWVASDIQRQIESVEIRLSRSFEVSRREHLDAVVTGVHQRVGDRISRLEQEVTGQAAAMAELRDCSMKTEQSVQRLLTGIDRLLSAQSGGRSEIPTPPPTEGTTQENSPRLEEVSPKRRWGIFG